MTFSVHSHFDLVCYLNVHSLYSFEVILSRTILLNVLSEVEYLWTFCIFDPRNAIYVLHNYTLYMCILIQSLLLIQVMLIKLEFCSSHESLLFISIVTCTFWYLVKVLDINSVS